MNNQNETKRFKSIKDVEDLDQWVCEELFNYIYMDGATDLDILQRQEDALLALFNYMYELGKKEASENESKRIH